METPHARERSGEVERTSPKVTIFDRNSLLDLVRSIVRHPAVKDAVVEMVVAGLSERAEDRLRDGVRAGADDALARLSDGLSGGVKEALNALSEDDWTLVACEVLEDAKGEAEAAAVA
jgi:hypothetical protein